MRIKIQILLFFIAFSLQFKLDAQPPTLKRITSKEIIDLKSQDSPSKDTLIVLNFWATWCKPCVEELPLFAEAVKTYKNERVKFIFVSMDAYKPNEESKIVTKLTKLKLATQSLWWMTETDANKYIDLISPKWSGSIPCTIFIKSSDQIYDFQERDFKGDELLKEINLHYKKE